MEFATDVYIETMGIDATVTYHVERGRVLVDRVESDGVDVTDTLETDDVVFVQSWIEFATR